MNSGFLLGSGAHASARMRVVYFAEPTDPDQAPKSVADEESVEAKWVALEDLQNLRFSFV